MRIARWVGSFLIVATLAIGATLVASSDGFAQAKSKSTEATPKAGKGEKVCRYKFPTGERRTWVCKKEEPCCAWDAITYVKCGSTITGCL